jgi:hypothetical protein
MATIALRASVTAGKVNGVSRISGSVSGLGEAATLDASIATVLALGGATEHAVVTADVAAAQAIGAGDASAEIDAVDVSVQAYLDAAAGDLNVNTELDALIAAVAAAQAIGAGDASAEIDTLDSAWVAYLAAVTKETALTAVDTDWTAYKVAADVEAGASGGVELSWDTAQVITIGDLHAAVDRLIQAAKGTGELTI